ncbi:hypothetical protein F6U93_05795 [Tamlana haliotis]|uniref:DUF4905 domain-containing protein n=1 Tax=Pseudotamlana haliotis TaxID=2614804 RepID=A0A6N6MIK7_9FLAO|nr:hypothetical protein [Tamlana haliotis]KAB1068630.1 hypothetical protein F6U93_05795 [Tamlana haliotis]
MYKIIERKSNVSGLKCFKGNVFINQNNILYNNNVELIKDVEGYSFWFLYDSIYFHNNDGIEFLKVGNRIKEIETPLFPKSLTNNQVFCCINFRRENRKWMWNLGMFDLESCSEARELPFENYTIELVVAGVGIGYFDKNKISALDIKESQIKWELMLNQFEEVELQRVLGIYQDQLLVACSNHLLLSIDVNTGGILHQWRELKGFEVGSFYKDVLPDPTNFVLDKSASKLIGVFDTFYFEINLDSKEISYHQLKDELSKYGVSDFRPFNNNSFTPEHLFLTAHTYLEEVPNVDLSSVLSLNRKTKKVDWIHIFKDVGLGTNVPKITNTHLYQLDTEQTLHIFKKETTSTDV